MKTIKQWFEELPDGYRERALRAMTHPDIKVDYMSDAIIAGIVLWSETNEGFDFWDDVYLYYSEDIRSLPDLPKMNFKK